MYVDRLYLFLHSEDAMVYCGFLRVHAAIRFDQTCSRATIRTRTPSTLGCRASRHAVAPCRDLHLQTSADQRGSSLWYSGVPAAVSNDAMAAPQLRYPSK